MPELSLNQVSHLIQTLKNEKGLETFDLNDSKMLWEKLENITLCEKRNLHFLMIKEKTKELKKELDRLGIFRHQQSLIK